MMSLFRNNPRQHCLIPSKSAITSEIPAVKNIFVLLSPKATYVGRTYPSNPKLPLAKPADFVYNEID